ncbi:MAG: CBS domain-containing protein [Bacillota bacterium]|nr:CBS domain-containing protein [Bacillota bacterium]
MKDRNVDLLNIINDAFYVQRSMPIDELLPTMSKERFTVAVVKDMQQKTVGVVSVEDILEELVGEIWDEDDAIGGEK